MHVFSASQFKKSEECLRRWAWKYIHGLGDPAGEGALLGKDCHTGWESWLKNGEPPVVAAIGIAHDRMTKMHAGEEVENATKLLQKGLRAYADRIQKICEA